ncbi:MAG TPA: hypothetical protein VNP73_03380 [Actinomycetota bacterium]|nr:hypothetical protein [Actinomycetota bacterium]
MTWILTRVFEVDPSGWSGTIRLPKSPEVAEYAVGAMCELGGHAYYPSSYSVYVGKRSG